ncbi:MAG: right-handed parallel beta-helix repeat-containing protein [Chitinophagales bacterium]|nr:right-handed parallel beta-helix repeat-containing protein [Chitinophagales bacterium]
MKTLSLITLTLITVFISEIVFAKTYYVATTGSDLNNGTSVSTPWKTIQKASNTAGAGSTINILGGTYFEKISINKSGNATKGFITYQNYNNEVVIIDATNISGNSDNIFYLYNKNYIRIQGLQLQNCVVPNNHDGAGVFIEGKGDHIEILNCKIHDITGDNAMGITVYGTNKIISVSNLIIDGNEIYDCEPAPSETLTLNGNVRLFQITNNLIHDVNNIGIDMIGGEGTCPNAANDNARNGICAGNEVYNARSIYGGGYAGGIYIDGGDSIVMERNLIHDCDLGIEVGCENKNTVATQNIIRNNIIYQNDKRGLSFGGYDYPNTGKVENCKFYNNTCYNNDILDVGEGELYIEYANNCEVKNNIFRGNGNSYLMNFYVTGTNGNSFDYNCWSVTTGNARFVYNNVLYLTYAAYLTGSLQDVHSINTDPLFVDVVNNNFHLNTSSLCKDAGDPAYIPSAGELDYYAGSRLFNSRIDMGASEFGNGMKAADNIFNADQLKIYPSIATNDIHVIIQSEKYQLAELFFVDASGKIRKTILVELKEGENRINADVSELENGIYLCEVIKNDLKNTSKFMISR